MASRVSSSFSSMPVRPARALLAAVVAASVLLTGCLFAPEKTRASRGMELALQDDSVFLVGNKRVNRAKAFKYAPPARRHAAAGESALGLHDGAARLHGSPQAGP